MDEQDLKQRISFTAHAVATRYYLTDVEDIVQELWLWVAGHQDKIDKWDFDEHGSAKLNKSLRNAAVRWARDESKSRSQLRTRGNTEDYY